MLEDLFMSVGFLPLLSRRRGVRWLVGITIVLLAWLTVSSAIAFRLTRRLRAWFPEPAPHVAWGSIEDHRLRTRDGQDIGAWFVEGTDKDNAPQILLLHGNKGSRANSLKRAEFLASAGYPVLMISLRAHGDSTGDFNDVGYSARHDVVVAVEFLGSYPKTLSSPGFYGGYTPFSDSYLSGSIPVDQSW